MQCCRMQVAIAIVFGSSLATAPAQAQRIVDSQVASNTSVRNIQTASTATRSETSDTDLSYPISPGMLVRPVTARVHSKEPDLGVNIAPSRRSRGRNALIGAGIGAAVGTGIGVALVLKPTSSGEGSTTPPQFIVAGGALAGGLLGALIGAIVHTGP